MSDETGKGHSEKEVQRNIEAGRRQLARANYEGALESFAQGRELASVLDLVSHRDELDYLIRRTRDRLRILQRMEDVTAALRKATETAARLQGLIALTRLVGQCNVMGYRRLAERIRMQRSSAIARLSDNQIIPLVQMAFYLEDYELVLALANGSEATQLQLLQEQADWALTNDIAPPLDEAEMLMNGNRPLDGLAILQDLRDRVPHSSTWRETWFKLCKRQGEGCLEKGMKSLAKGHYLTASYSIEMALRALKRGVEAYPESSSLQILMAEANALLDIACMAYEADSKLEELQAAEARERFQRLERRLSLLKEHHKAYPSLRNELGQYLIYLQNEAKRDAHSKEEHAGALALIAQCSTRAFRVQEKSPLPYSPLRGRGLSRPAKKEVARAPREEPLSISPFHPHNGIEESGHPASRYETAQDWFIYFEPRLSTVRAAFLDGDLRTAAKAARALADELEEQADQESDE